LSLIATVAGIEEDQHIRLNSFGLTTNADGSIGTDQDIESFFRVLAGGPC
jgi:hypothetical protein